MTAATPQILVPATCSAQLSVAVGFQKEMVQEIHRGLLPGDHSNIQRAQTQDVLPPPQVLQFKATANGKMSFMNFGL